MLLTGGSAFGLDAAAGVMQYLRETGRGYSTPFARIPIVPAAVIFDLPILDSSAFPSAENAYEACRQATVSCENQGSIGAGTGATVGKWAGIENCMKGGIGLVKQEMDGLWIHSLSVVNPVGDVVNKEGHILAGAHKNGEFLAGSDTRIRWNFRRENFGENTILVAVMTNARLTKAQLYYLAERSHNGIVRSVMPAHTSFDGDIVFSMTTDQVETSIDFITEMAIETVRQSIVQSVIHAESVGGIPAVKDLIRRKS